MGEVEERLLLSEDTEVRLLDTDFFLSSARHSSDAFYVTSVFLFARFDLTKVPDIYDMIRFDVLHNSHLEVRQPSELS